MLSCTIQTAWPAAACQVFRTLDCCFPCGHQSCLTSHIGAKRSQADQRLFLAFIVIDMTCGFVLAPQMCHSLYEIVGSVWVPTATAQVTIEECFIASGHTLLCWRELEMESRYSEVVFVCVYFSRLKGDALAKQTKRRVRGEPVGWGCKSYKWICFLKFSTGSSSKHTYYNSTFVSFRVCVCLFCSFKSIILRTSSWQYDLHKTSWFPFNFFSPLLPFRLRYVYPSTCLQ